MLTPNQFEAELLTGSRYYILLTLCNIFCEDTFVIDFLYDHLFY